MPGRHGPFFILPKKRSTGGLDSVSTRLSGTEQVVVQGVTVDLVQQDLISSRGADLDTLQLRTGEMARRLRRIAIVTKSLTDSVSSRWRSIDERLAQLKTTLDGIR